MATSTVSSGGNVHHGVLPGVAGTDAVNVDQLLAAIALLVSTSRSIIAGAGTVGGGDLSADRTINVVAGNGSIIVSPDSISVGVLQNDGMHGSLGGAGLHALVTTSVAGFMSAADKVKLDGLS